MTWKCFKNVWCILGILKSAEKVAIESSEVQGILKQEGAKTSDKDVKSILKPDHPQDHDQEQKSILKHSDEVHTIPKQAESKSILKHEDDVKENDFKAVKPILKHEEEKSQEQTALKPILKHEEEKSQEQSAVKPILKHEEELEKNESSVKAILRKTESEDKKGKSEDVKPILKHVDASDDSVRSKDFEMKRKSIEEELLLTPILKHSEEKESEKEFDVKGVLKKDKSLELTSEPRGILKKESSFETKVIEPEKSALKKSLSKDMKDSQKSNGILHKEEDGTAQSEIEITEIETVEVAEEVVDDSVSQKRRARDPAERERWDSDMNYHTLHLHLFSTFHFRAV